ncbi:MAG: peptide-methionine (R)-S-oxide reductase MsrB [Patescibacteria group bacterium]
MPDDHWKEKLTPEQYAVLRSKETEAPFTGEYWNEHTEGMYRCAGCGAELFDSHTKFDSGTGWPSFSEAKPGAVVFEHDATHGMNRTEAVCAKCGGHLGHVFDDGPEEKGGKRFCINSCALNLEEK